MADSPKSENSRVTDMSGSNLNSTIAGAPEGINVSKSNNTFQADNSQSILPQFEGNSPMSPRQAVRSPNLGSQNYNRYKYYSALKTQADAQSQNPDNNISSQKKPRGSFLQIPEHLVENYEALYLINIPGQTDSQGKHSSFVTIFSVWNGMAGTGMVTIPWAYQQAGLGLGSVLTMVAFVMSTFTCYLVILTAGNDLDYTDSLRRYFGKPGWVFGMVCFILNLYVPILLFFQLLAQTLFPVLLFIIESFNGKDRVMELEPDWSQFSYTWTCVIIFAINFCVLAIRNLNIFVKINSFGVIFITIVLVVICGVGFYGFSDTEYVYKQSVYDEYVQTVEQEKEQGLDVTEPYTGLILLINGSYNSLMGILGGGFYFHNISLPVIRNAKNPENNVRDVCIGYFMVFMTYWLCGILGYYGFVGETFEAKDPSGTAIEQNCLNMFKIKSGLGTFVRISCFLQLLCVNALLFACERAQILLVITGKQEAKNWQINLFVNFCLMIPSFLLAIYYPQVGDVAGLAGSFATMLCIYLLPVGCYIKMKYDEISLPTKALVAEDEQHENGAAVEEMMEKLTTLGSEDIYGAAQKEQNKRRQKWYFILIGGILIIAYGVYVFVAQFL